jgi:surface protein
VEVKALKTAPEVNLRLDFLKKGEKIYELVKLLENNLRIKLTDSNYRMSQLFIEDYRTRTSFPLGDCVTDCLTTMKMMFHNCYNLTSLDVSKFNTSNVTNMNNMFYSCVSLTSLDLSKFNTGKVTDMSHMFSSCTNIASLDVSNFDTSNVKNMWGMFSGCYNLTSLDISNFDTNKVVYMQSVFSYCQNLTEIKGVIDMKSCKYVSDMFKNCSELSGVKIKNPPEGFTNHDVNTGLNSAGLRADQYIIVE